MTSRDAVADLVHAYAERLDAGELDGVAALFADATYGRAGGPVRHGAAEVRGALDVVKLHHGVPRTKHVITNVVVEVDEAAGTASARSYFTVLQATAKLPLQVILAGRYHDRFRCIGAAWRFSERVIHIDLMGELEEHLNDAARIGRSQRSRPGE
jgi:3-phenylpropionate/cinnamic acid dioxygenase small subunit